MFGRSQAARRCQRGCQTCAAVSYRVSAAVKCKWHQDSKTEAHQDEHAAHSTKMKKSLQGGGWVRLKTRSCHEKEWNEKKWSEMECNEVTWHQLNEGRWEWTNELKIQQNSETNEWTNERMNEWRNEEMKGRRIKKWMKKWRNEGTKNNPNHPSPTSVTFDHISTPSPEKWHARRFFAFPIFEAPLPTFFFYPVEIY